MDATELAFAGIARQAQLVRDGEVSSRELVEVYLERIGRLDGRLNAFRVVSPERSLAEADQADARRKGGDERPLLGVPIAIKDEVDVAGEVTACGIGVTTPPVGPARADSEVVRRLREAGAVVLGKTNVPELTIWPFTETAAWGATRNPWDPTRTPGGSSGGSGAAVAAGLVGAALGSDGGGSIRIPAACCGLFGLKTTRGRISYQPIGDEHWHGLSVLGPLTRRVADAALFLDATADDGPHAPPLPDRPFAEAAAAAPGRLRIALSTKMLLPGPLDGEWRGAFDETGALLRSLGHDVVERDPDYGPVLLNFIARYLRGIRDDVAEARGRGRMERRTLAMARLGGLVPRAALTRARRQEADLAKRIVEPVADCDVLVTPALAGPPLAVGLLEGRGALWTFNRVAGFTPYTAPWNATGQPGAVVPTGLDSRGMPLAVQLVGRSGGEATLLSLAAQLEAERPWADRRPPVS